MQACRQRNEKGSRRTDTGTQEDRRIQGQENKQAGREAAGRTQRGRRADMHTSVRACRQTHMQAGRQAVRQTDRKTNRQAINQSQRATPTDT